MRAMPPEPTTERVAIGSRIRAIRKAQHLTIDELASITGLTKGFISRVERDLTSPSVNTLVAICDVLSISVGSLFERPEVLFVPAESGPKINLGGVNAEERLLSPRTEARLQVIRAKIGPGGHGGNELYAIAADFDLLHVLTGEVTVQFASTEWTVRAGDTLNFNGREPHSWVAGPEGAEVIWALAPALWSV